MFIFVFVLLLTVFIVWLYIRVHYLEIRLVHLTRIWKIGQRLIYVLCNESNSNSISSSEAITLILNFIYALNIFALAKDI